MHATLLPVTHKGFSFNAASNHFVHLSTFYITFIAKRANGLPSYSCSHMKIN